jgi:hypothetical protein
LSVTPGFFAAERIAISKDGKKIYYNEQNGYNPTSITRSKYYSYNNNKWNGPYVLFEGYGCIAFSSTDDTLFCQKGSEPFYSVKSGSNWVTPKRIISKYNAGHYFQETNNGQFYAGSRPKSTTGKGEWCKFVINGADTIVVSLGLPLNSFMGSYNFSDFYVSKDDSFFIGSSNSALWISHHMKDGNWTTPQNLSSKINFGLAMWGTYVSADNKYLFYTTGTKNDYSDTYIYWVRIDNLIDSLRKTAN